MKLPVLSADKNKRFEVDSAWRGLVSWVVARFTRGNISAQQGRILFPEEQNSRREVAIKIAQRMKNRKSAS